MAGHDSLSSSLSSSKSVDSSQYTNDYGLSPDVFGRASGSSNGTIRLADQDRHLDPDSAADLAELNAQMQVCCTGFCCPGASKLVF